MRRADVRAGAIAAQVSRWSVTPVVFLEHGAQGVWYKSRKVNGGFFVMAGDAPRANAGGYAAVTGPLIALEGLDCEAELKRFAAGEPPSNPLASFTLVHTLRNVRPSYSAERAARDSEYLLESTTRKRRQLEAERQGKEARELAAKLREAGVDARPLLIMSGDTRVTLSVDAARELLERLTVPVRM